jgi:hypothetical protein
MLPKDPKLLRLVSARSDIADSLVAYRLLKNLQPNNELFEHILLSMAVCYGRPFSENHGIGSLRVEYPHFPDFTDPQMNLRHHRLIDLRNKFMAHSSSEGTRLVILPPGIINPATGQVVDRHDHNVGKRTFPDVRFIDWLKDVMWELKGRLDNDVRKRLAEVGAKLTEPTEMETGYDSFQWTIPKT